jgi:uncharacterized membrane protein
MSSLVAVADVGRGIEFLGVAVIAISAAGSLGQFAVSMVRRSDREEAYRNVRRRVGQGILLGLEVLVAGDIVRTVAADPSLTSVAVLGAIVLIRTFLSVTIDTEVNGTWPWRRGLRPLRSKETDQDSVMPPPDEAATPVAKDPGWGIGQVCGGRGSSDQPLVTATPTNEVRTRI